MGHGLFIKHLTIHASQHVLLHVSQYALLHASQYARPHGFNLMVIPDLMEVDHVILIFQADSLQLSIMLAHLI